MSLPFILDNDTRTLWGLVLFTSSKKEECCIIQPFLYFHSTQMKNFELTVIFDLYYRQ